ncbi:NUD1 [[Candida] subhashii]|uniref:NUD1 n=1 Tax=[Candida] subhashii TaxID=561895 RepID=A0A8J5QJ70_9ASCO|nr:NUD1 [[Candida] subhashii]KAG7665691.1 NUD1 [[Candida] subhashii]
MTTRVVSEAPSSVVSMGGMDINTFIQETKLSDVASYPQTNKSDHSVNHITDENTPTSATDRVETMEKQNEFTHPSNNGHLLQVIPEYPTNNSEPTNLSILDQSSPEHIKPSNGGYQNHLKYIPNHDFSGNRSSMFVERTFDSPGPSVPNTFQYKSHPNAKTKNSLIAMVSDDETTSEHSQSQYQQQQNQLLQQQLQRQNSQQEENENTPPFKTSTIQKPNSGATPPWMPDGLHDKWPTQNTDEFKYSVDGPPKPIGESEFNSSVRITKRSSQPQFSSFNFDKELGSINTIIHHSQLQSAETPAWKRVNNEYNQNSKPVNNMQNIFHTMDSHDESNNNHNNKSLSTTTNISTPMITKQMSIPKELSQENSTQLENILEQDKSRTPARSNNPESPLKLYHAQYDTYTKERLNGVLEQLQGKSNMNTPINEVKNNPSRPSSTNKNEENHPLGIKNFVKSGAYNEDFYKKNADNVFKNIKRRGFTLSNSTNFNESKLGSQTTATSTPKTNKLISHIEDEVGSENEYASYTSGFESLGNDDGDIKKIDDSDNMSKNYTSYTKESIDHTESPYQSSHSGSEYTFDGEDDNNEENSLEKNEQSVNAKEHNGAKLDFYRYTKSRLKSPHKPIDSKVQEKVRIFNTHAQEENKVLRADILSPMAEQNSTAFDLQDKDATYEEIIRWKNASQLRLAQSNSQPNQKSNVIKGRLMPDENLPTEYGNMILDDKEHKWKLKSNITNNENKSLNTLESIEDLTTNSKFIRNTDDDASPNGGHPDQSILKKGPSWTSKRRNSNNKLEVSFHLPSESEEKTSPVGIDVTRMSQLDADFTFSQSNSKLISIINEIFESANASGISWEHVNEISLAQCNLNNVKDLDQLLPNLRSLDLSRNEIRYLTGIPPGIFALDLSENEIDDMTSFGRLFDLQGLNLSGNAFTQVSNLRECMHLTTLNLSQNNINNLDGIGGLVHLIDLDLSGNRLSGHLNFQMFDLPKLATLYLDENKLEVVSGLENLPELRVLYLEENNLTELTSGYHKNLKKLSVKFNNLQSLDLESFPCLRYLRIDGNRNLHNLNWINELKKIEEVSCKAMAPQILDSLFSAVPDVKVLDLSGNIQLSQALPTIKFRYVSKLTLSAINLTSIPQEFHHVFPNVQDLNLNFNKLHDISGLANLRLRKCCLVSNNIERLQHITDSLYPSRRSLISLDVRLNTMNTEFYPYMFSPDEVNGINLETVDDIENFSIHYHSLKKSGDWNERDRKFCSGYTLGRRELYEQSLILCFYRLVKLDGNEITQEKRAYLRELAKQRRSSAETNM